MRSVEHQLLSDSESVVCCATSEVGVWRRPADFLPLGPLGVHECVVPPDWAGPPLQHNQRAGLQSFLFLLPPPSSLSSLSLSASLSPPREQSRTREQRHVYVQRTDGHTPTLRTPCAPLKAKTTCCDYIFNIESSSLYNLLMLLGADLQGFTFFLILACNVNFIAEVLFSKACGIFSLNLWAWDTKYWWFEGFFMKKRGIYS